MGADESGTIGTAQLTYAMSLDGFLPHSLAKTGKKSGAPYVAIIVLCSTAFIVSVFGGLASLINASVFLLAFVYLSTCLSTSLLIRKYPDQAKGFKGKYVVPILGAAFSLLVILLTALPRSSSPWPSWPSASQNVFFSTEQRKCRSQGQSIPQNSSLPLWRPAASPCRPLAITLKLDLPSEEHQTGVQEIVQWKMMWAHRAGRSCPG